MSVETRYVWWPAYRTSNIDLADARHIPGHLLAIAALTGVLCLPPVTRATGIEVGAVLAMIGVHVAWFVVSALTFGRGLLSKSRANIAMAGNLIVNCSIAVALPVATGDPRTPLWMFPLLYACLNGALQERERCIAFLLAHVLAPLVALVPLLTADSPTSWSMAAPLVCAALSAVAYNHLSGVSARWRERRTEQNAAVATLRAQVAARDRERLLGDLGDSIGSTFSVVGMYGDLIDRHIERPDELRTLAALVRDAARSSLGELRGVLGAMSATAGDVAGLASTLTRSGARAAEGSKLEIIVAVTADPAIAVDVPTRLIVVHVFQHVLRGVRAGGGTSRVEARLASGGGILTFEISGAITDAIRDRQIAERVTELGGTVTQAASAANGTTLRLSLPRGP